MKKKKRLLLLLPLFLLLFIVFKFYETLLLQDITNTHNIALIKNAEYMLDNNEKLGIFFNNFNKLIVNQEPEYAEVLKIYSDLNDSSNILLNDENEYLMISQNTVRKFVSFENKNKFLIGNTGNQIKKLNSALKNYYLTQVNNSQDSINQTYAIVNIINVWRDNYILNVYDTEGIKKPALLKDNYGNISVLEKYTDPNYRFFHESEISVNYPNMFRILKKYKEYFRLYFNMAKNYVADNKKSYSELYSQFRNTSSEINFNFVEILGEGSEYRQNIHRNSIDSEINVIRILKTLKNEKLFLLPFIVKTTNVNNDFETCLLYINKLSLYPDVTGKYPSASSLDLLIKQLSEIAPKTEDIDVQFNSSFMNYFSEGNKIDIDCIDKSTNKKYSFSFRRDF